MFTIDLHLDLAMNALEWNRDLRLSVSGINERESGKLDLAGRGGAMVSFPALRAGQVGLVVATQIARYVAPGNPLPGWHSPEQAWAHTQGQLAWYRAMEACGEMVQIRTRVELDAHVDRWLKAGMASSGLPIGFILSLEGADSLVNLNNLDIAWGYGIRAIGPAHYGPGRYANGTDAQGAMGPQGVALLEAMDRLGMILDATHLCDDAFWQAMDIFQGPVWASHQACRQLVPHNRQFDDAQLRRLLQRGAIIGAPMDAWMIVPGWKRGVSDPVSMGCNLDTLINHIEHICMLAGNRHQVCIGSDLDGGFGREQSPSDMHTIADLQRFPDLLSARGFTDEDILGFMHGNALRFLRQSLP